MVALPVQKQLFNLIDASKNNRQHGKKATNTWHQDEYVEG